MLSFTFARRASLVSSFENNFTGKPDFVQSLESEVLQIVHADFAQCHNWAAPQAQLAGLIRVIDGDGRDGALDIGIATATGRLMLAEKLR